MIHDFHEVFSDFVMCPNGIRRRTSASYGRLGGEICQVSEILPASDSPTEGALVATVDKAALRGGVARDGPAHCGLVIVIDESCCCCCYY